MDLYNSFDSCKNAQSLTTLLITSINITNFMYHNIFILISSNSMQTSIQINP